MATQYDNYIEAGSSAYDSFMTFNDRAPVLNDDQAVIFNQIRILTTALNNWGTLGDLSKNVAPTGTIAYHIKNSDFEIFKFIFSRTLILPNDFEIFSIFKKFFLVIIQH